MNINILYRKLEEINQSIIKYQYYLIRKNSSKKRGLFDGNWGMILFLLYYHKYLGSSYDIEKIVEFHLHRLVLEVPETFTFCSGLTGILFILNHLSQTGFLNIDIKDAESQFDTYLNRALSISMKYGGYDFLHGTIGMGIYYFKRNDLIAIKHLNDIVDYLENISIEKDNIIKWEFVNSDMERVPNISLSHGISSIIIFLSMAFNRGIQPCKSQRLLKGAVNFVLSQKLEVSKHGVYYPNISLEATNSNVSRLAWCYGDLGVAFSLLRASKALKCSKLYDEAMIVLRHATQRRNLEDSCLYEAGICHGTGGVAQIFRRLFFETNDRLFLSTSDFWIKETIKMAKYPDGIAGFKCYSNDGWKNSYDLLLGVAGIGLVLLSSVCNLEKYSQWDEILLIS